MFGYSFSARQGLSLRYHACILSGLDKETRGSFLLCSYPGRISFAGFFSSFFFVIACFEGVFMAGLPGPGDRIEARCTRCNDITGHVIVALVGGEIVKVECRACGSVLKYYPPATPKEAKGKTAVCRVKAGETRKEAVNSFKPTSTPSTAAASPAAVSRPPPKRKRPLRTWSRIGSAP